MAGFGRFAANLALDARDPTHYHVYRARYVNNNWEYDTRCSPIALFPNAQAFLDCCNEDEPPETAPASTAQPSSSRRGTQPATESRSRHGSRRDQGTRHAEQSSYNPFRQRSSAVADGRSISRAGAATVGPGMMRSMARRLMPTLSDITAAIPGRRTRTRNDAFRNIPQDEQDAVYGEGRVIKMPASCSNAAQAALQNADALRLVILHKLPTYFLCLAIYTYDRRGCLDQPASDHVIIHTTEEAPAPLAGEESILTSRTPVRVTLLPGLEVSERFHPTSRLNLKHILRFDFDGPVMPLGRVSVRTRARINQLCFEIQSAGMIAAGVQLLADDDDEDEVIAGPSGT